MFNHMIDYLSLFSFQRSVPVYTPFSEVFHQLAT